MIPNGNLDDLLQGVLERILFVKDGQGGFKIPLQPEIDFKTAFQDFRDEMRNRSLHLSKLSWAQLQAMYSGPKLTQLRNVIESLRSKPVCRNDSRLNIFVKVEKTDTRKKPLVCRVIYGPHLRYNACLARFLRAAEHHVYKAIDDLFEHPTVMKSYNLHEQGQIIHDAWMQFDDPVALMADISRCDQHTSVAALRDIEFPVYLQYFYGADRDELNDLLQWQLHNKMFAHTPDGFLKASVEGGRGSGFQNTGSGNVVVMCALIWTYMKNNGINMRLINNGDDCVLITGRRMLQRLQGLNQWFADCGFALELSDPVEVMEHIDFCQTRPVHNGLQYIMVRNHSAVLSKDGHSIRPLMDPYRSTYYDAIGKGGLALNHGIPVQQARALSWLRLVTTDRRVKLDRVDTLTGILRHASRVKQGATQRQITEYSRYSYWLAFGVTPDEQIALEDEFNRVTGLDVDLEGSRPDPAWIGCEFW